MLYFVCGQLCSGKSVFAQSFCKVTDAEFIEVGDIVREIKNSTDRSVLQNSKHLFYKIVEAIRGKIANNVYKDYVICGVRQREILEHFPDAVMTWISCPVIERRKRYNNRLREGDTISFEEAEEGDISLGILEVKDYILERNN